MNALLYSPFELASMKRRTITLDMTDTFLCGNCLRLSNSDDTKCQHNPRLLTIFL